MQHRVLITTGHHRRHASSFTPGRRGPSGPSSQLRPRHDLMSRRASLPWPCTKRYNCSCAANATRPRSHSSSSCPPQHWHWMVRQAPRGLERAQHACPPPGIFSVSVRVLSSLCRSNAPMLLAATAAALPSPALIVLPVIASLPNN